MSQEQCRETAERWRGAAFGIWGGSSVRWALVDFTYGGRAFTWAPPTEEHAGAVGYRVPLSLIAAYHRKRSEFTVTHAADSTVYRPTPEGWETLCRESLLSDTLVLSHPEFYFNDENAGLVRVVPDSSGGLADLELNLDGIANRFYINPESGTDA